MYGVGTPWAFLFQNPIIGIAVFLLVSAGVIVVLSGGRLGDALGGMFRIFLTIFTTPFEFLRDAIRIMRTSKDEEQDYAGSTVFVMFRGNRIQYMLLLVLCLLILSGGLTTALISLYPSGEIAYHRQLSEQVRGLEQETEAAQQAVDRAAAPEYREQLATARAEARSAYERVARANEAALNQTPYTGPAIDQLRYARSAESANRVRQNIDNYMSGCPRAWRNMTVESCNAYRTFVLDLADQRANEFNLAAAATEADRAWRDADYAAQSVANQLADAQARLDAARQQREDAAPFSLDRMSQRLIGALMIILGALLTVIFVAWFGATLIDLGNWIILMMRSLELTQKQKLEAARPPRDD
jgi:hypothetical protein